MIKLKNNQAGFTIIELLIASAVFSIVILGASVAIIQIGRLYYKGIVVSRTQTVARDLVESISMQIQYSGASVSGTGETANTGDIGLICIGGYRYMYSKYTRQGGGFLHAGWRDELPCSSPLPNLNLPQPSVGGKDLVGENMSILNMSVLPVVGNDGLYNISVTVIYGEHDLVEPPANASERHRCRGSDAGSQWCSVVTYNTKVFAR